jgi:hypothetical protein
LIWQALSWLRVGLSVESPGVYFYRSTRTTGVESQAIDEGRLEAESSDETLTKLTLRPYAPVRARLGAALTLPSATLSAEVDVQSPIDDDTVDVHRKASWNARAGARIRLSERYRFGAGLFTDRDPDRVYNGTGAIHFYGGTAGIQYENVRWLATEDRAGEPRSGLTFSTTVAVRYAYGSGKFGGLYYGEPDWTQTIRPTNVSIHELTLHIGSGLYF